MLTKSKGPAGKTLYTSRPLLISPKDAYLRPKAEGADWFQTTTTVWRVDELIRRRVRDWRRLLGETGHSGERNEVMRKDHDSVYTSTHSVFPAPLVEWILLRYGGPAGGRVLDAFAGGAVRGMVSSVMGYRYTGVEVRLNQIHENQQVLEALNLTGAEYVHDTGTLMSKVEGPFDCALTCPPYYDLEVYSDLPEDISTLSTYEAFNSAMLDCAVAHKELMKPNSFVCIVVGPFRNKKTGELIDFPAHTVNNFKAAGFVYWQQIMLAKNFASAAKRSTNAWKGQKLVPCHEVLQVFRTPERGDDERQHSKKSKTLVRSG